MALIVVQIYIPEGDAFIWPFNLRVELGVGWGTERTNPWREDGRHMESNHRARTHPTAPRQAVVPSLNDFVDAVHTEDYRSYQLGSRAFLAACPL